MIQDKRLAFEIRLVKLYKHLVESKRDMYSQNNC